MIAQIGIKECAITAAKFLHNLIKRKQVTTNDRRSRRNLSYLNCILISVGVIISSTKEWCKKLEH